MSRLAVALVMGVATAVCAVALLGIIGPGPILGAGDNGDGARLHCGAGIVPDTPDGGSAWRGGVVLDFTRDTPCADPLPSSALPLLRAATAGRDPFHLGRLGWLYALSLGAVTAVAAWAAAGGRGPIGRRLARVGLLLPVLVAVMNVDYLRLFVSTFAEPAGLLGAYALLCGAVVAVATRSGDRVERAVALLLMAGGGLLAGTAKLGHLPLLLLATALCAATGLRVGTRRWAKWVVGPVVALAVIGGAIGPARASMDWQERHYTSVNTHNLVHTVVLVEVPGSAAALGLPPEAAARAGRAYYPDDPSGTPGAERIAADPEGVRAAAWRVLLGEPAAALRALGVGMQATGGRALTYLRAHPWRPGTAGPALGTVLSGAQGADPASLRSWLDAMPHPWWPSLLALLGLLAGLAGPSLRRGRPWAARLARIAGAAAAGAVGIVAVAVLGDGYFEIAKHVWLAAYLLDVTALALAALPACALIRPHPRT